MKPCENLKICLYFTERKGNPAMKYALIGCGRIAVNHIKAALNNHLEICAVCDVKPEAMEALLAKYGLEKDEGIAAMRTTGNS